MQLEASTDIDRELELEKRSLQIGHERIREKIKRTGLEETQGGKSIIKRIHADYSERIDLWSEGEQAKRFASSAFKYVRILSSSQLSLLVSRTVLHTLNNTPVLYDVLVSRIADVVVQAVSAELYAEKDKDGFTQLARKLDWQSKAYVRKRIAEEEFTNECIEVAISEKDKAALGAVLLELFLESTGLFESKLVKKGKAHTVRVLDITEKGSEWLSKAIDDNWVAEPFRLPMVMRPYAWTTLNDGGYLLQDTHGADLVRIKNSPHARQLLESADLTQVMDAVNAIQDTPWRINRRVYNVWKQLIGTGKAGCSNSEEILVPDAVDPEDELFKTVKEQRRDAFEAIQKNNSVKCTEAQKLRMAEIFEDEDRFYYPHNLDFRGRIYPLAGVGAINPQGDDSGKALLEFAVGKPLGEDGLQWLYIHTQNCWGNDKVSLQDRIDATQDNLGDYVSFANSPLECTGWMEADKPFMFLACCFELLSLTEEDWDLNGPEEFISFLPIALDGTCSGLQHFAALMLDEGLAEAVNVKQINGRPADIYGAVGSNVRANLEGILVSSQDEPEADTDEADYWLNLITRDLVKQPVMTLAYGVTAAGMRSQIVDKCKKLSRKGKGEYLEGSRGSNPKYLAQCIHDAIGEVSTAAFDVMDWLGDLARARYDAYPDSLLGAVSWTSPVGLPVLQEYFEYESERINIFVDGRRLSFTRRLGHGSAVHKAKQVQGVAPNFIHSLDAAHLMMTVNACVEEGVEHFAMIHDSFGTHAADAGVLFEVLRREFIHMYESDWLQDLYEEQADCVDITPPPSRRGLDLQAVQESEFFFS